MFVEREFGVVLTWKRMGNRTFLVSSSSWNFMGKWLVITHKRKWNLCLYRLVAVFLFLVIYLPTAMDCRL